MREWEGLPPLEWRSGYAPALACDCRQIAIMWQSFAAIGRGTSEIRLPKEKKRSRAEYKPVRNGCSGRPNKPVGD